MEWELYLKCNAIVGLQVGVWHHQIGLFQLAHGEQIGEGRRPEGRRPTKKPLLIWILFRLPKHDFS